MVKKIVVHKILSDIEISKMEGEYFPQNHYHTILTEDADVYTEDGRILLKFRKNVIPLELCAIALDAYKNAAKKKHDNRGASAGVLDKNKLPNYVEKLVNPGKFRSKYINISHNESKQAASNEAPSNIIGFYDKPDRNLKGKGAPCRLTAFSRDHPELWNMSLPFLKHLDLIFQQLLPDRHHVQYQRAQLTPQFVVPDTSFSTVTINYSWRTALHKDAGDLKEGFGNLVVIEDPENPNTYDGCYTGFPQYGVAVDVRTGDFLAMDVHEWHCNTEFVDNTGIRDELLEKYTGNKKQRDIINDWHYNRMSVVCYLRENMIQCKDLQL